MLNFTLVLSITLFSSWGFARSIDNNEQIATDAYDIPKAIKDFELCLNQKTDEMVKRASCTFSSNLMGDIHSITQQCNMQTYRSLMAQTSFDNVQLAVERLKTVDSANIIENKINMAIQDCGSNGSVDIEAEGVSATAIGR